MKKRVHELAKELKVPLCDLRKAFLAYLKDKNSDNKDKGVLTTDGVHLSPAGDAFVHESVGGAHGEDVPPSFPGLRLHIAQPLVRRKGFPLRRRRNQEPA